MMKSFVILLLVFILSSLAFCQQLTFNTTTDALQFHNCSRVTETGNFPHLFDMSEIYKCDEGSVTISGKLTKTIENGYVYDKELGRPLQPYPVTKSDYLYYKWCPTNLHNVKIMCGDKPITCWDGKTATWDKNWQGYSCVTQDHMSTKKNP